jgi:hypothetical protein
MNRHRLIVALLIIAAVAAAAVGLVDWLAHAHVCVDCCAAASC